MTGTKHQVIIPQDVYDKIMHWVNKTDIEVSGFGKVIRDKETGVFTVVDAYLIKQEGGAAHTDIDEAALGKLMFLSKDQPGDLRWWWHSHVKMDVFWSGTDTKTIRDFGVNGWLLATVFNQHYEMRSALAYRTESDFGLATTLVDQIETEIHREIDPELCALWDAEFALNVSEKKWTPQDKWLEQQGKRYLDQGNNQTSLLGWDGNSYHPRGYTAEDKAIAEMLGTDLDGNPLDDPEYNERDPGWLGYGIKVEAKALGMSPQAYLAVLNGDDKRRIKKLTDKLNYLDNKGKFNHIGNA